MRYPLALLLCLVTSLSVAAEPTHNLNPAFVDLHFGTLSGVGWFPTEPGAIVEATANAPIPAGSFTIPVSNTSGFSRGQLACYEAEDKTFYPVVVKAVTDGALQIDRPLPSPIAAGGKVYNFYNNDSHANKYGFACVADDALRQLSTRPMLRRAAQFKVSSGWEPINGAQVTSVATVDYGGVGGQVADGLAMEVRTQAAGGGVASKAEVMFYENIVTNVVINPGTQAGKQSAALDISVVELRKTGEVIEAAKVRVNRDDTIISQDIPYTIIAGSKVRIKVTVPNSGDSVFYPGSITHYHALSQPEDLNHGKHVLFGDSWFVSGGDFHYRLIKRLDKAVVVSKGIVGNRIDQMVARFFKDVAPEKPDYVWINVSTNNYYFSTSNEDLQRQMTYLLDYIRSIGAKPIFFSPTVGAIVPNTNVNQLQKSRSYAINTLYVPAVMYYRSPLALPVISSN
ncbi:MULTISPECIES: SGNH/GDSL hydrolase family protein [unclassified Pseudomonas]|uniref:Putative GDSL-like lipase/acylhydrolase n=1 Tax=viral metagenome TaxID=1070528 RepID=A0A6M3M106_9ZZZZ|nr:MULTISPECIES: SGNH/GDSL hydrolase family protein [unclassified Pseudomonas]MBU0523510.1 SGNH/GDSL hydrolase family protein [Gammaproteobacteria bacterium]MBU0819940.1 SGNH/GDSL hydrolase family protein [Gammaproteobacteria bacterium]MBU0842063.1 SGNH/GDSL hydrolase family protein [Gammaproteobacteria bacterium]MBU1842890.1 SGNH/GDSL hydrolase family protein [Gammaproteobacteria bacterium]PMV86014.1 hypothetical protein C1X56_16370 [Pseudomonas sp. GW101-1A09]